jgi:hypothetical protein
VQKRKNSTLRGLKSSRRIGGDDVSDARVVGLQRKKYFIVKNISLEFRRKS